MKQAIAILLGYLTCTDPVMVNKWQNLLASFWHKDEGKLVTTLSVAGNGDVTIEVKDGDNATTTVLIEKYVKPSSEAIAYIAGLQDALNAKVDKVVGKQLSTEDFTTVLKNKLDGLNNYVHPPFHTTAEITDLDTILTDHEDRIAVLEGTSYPVGSLFTGVLQGRYVVGIVKSLPFNEYDAVNEVFPRMDVYINITDPLLATLT